MRDEIKELDLEICNHENYRKIFYDKFKDIDNEFMSSFGIALDNMTPSERTNKIDILPPIPLFLDDTDGTFNLQVSEEVNEDIDNLALLLNTSAGNITRIMYYLSLPEHLYCEFPYLLDHYRVIEMVLNMYLETINPEKRFNYYEYIKNLV